jgi:hypothetical protein
MFEEEKRFSILFSSGILRCAIGSSVTDVSKDGSDFIFRDKVLTVQCNIQEVFKQHRYEHLKSRKRFLHHGIWPACIDKLYKF